MSGLPHKILVIGLGRSGTAAARKLKQLRKEVKAIDVNITPEMVSVAKEMEKEGIEVKLGKHQPSDLENQELVIVSPGVSPGAPILAEARGRKIPIWSEIELAYRLTARPIIGVTGTNGKTTTTVLIGEIFEQASRPNVIAGNIGLPLVEGVDKASSNAILVTELSSFQLENIVEFRPHVGVLLNVAEDHLDWHPNFKEYQQAKKRLFLNQEKSDFAVINYDDPIVRNLAKATAAQTILCSKKPLQKGVFLKGGQIIVRLGSKEERVCSNDELKIKGEHNLDNAMAAAAACLVTGVKIEAIRKALISFKGLEHRLEHVATINGVDYFNDSKATNPDATVKALMAFKRPLVLLLGGRNKGNSFTPVEKATSRKARSIVVFGEAGDEIKLVFNGKSVEVIQVFSVEEAVKAAAQKAQAGDVVLFSPACASFDAFSSYKERGKVFKAAVRDLAGSK